MAEFRKNTGQTRSEGGSCDETIGTKEVDHFEDGDDEKGRQIFRKKIWATPSVAAPGDTNPSDASVGLSSIKYDFGGYTCERLRTN